MKDYSVKELLPTVIVDEHLGTMIKMPNGDLIRGLIKTVVEDHMNEPTTVTATFYVNLAPTK